MFCRTCGAKISEEANFCSKCGVAQTKSEPQEPSNESYNGGNSSFKVKAQKKSEPHSNESHNSGKSSFKVKDAVPNEKAEKKVKSFNEFKKAKGKEWKSHVSKKEKNMDGNVSINIGLYEWNCKDRKLKPKRGKRTALTVSNTAPYAEVLCNAVNKWKLFHSDCYDEKEDYMLLLEDGKEALFLPGSHKEFFTLKRYREELGKDYNKIILYLCTRSDFYEDDDTEIGPSCSKKARQFKEYFNCDDAIEEVHSDNSQHSPSHSEKCQEWNTGVQHTEEVEAQVNSDETLAREIQFQLDNNPTIPTITIEEESIVPAQEIPTDLASLVKNLEENVDITSQLFLVVRRGATFRRLLSLWQRECKRTSPQKLLRVKYMGENGIDSGAMSKEFLANAIPQMGAVMFPNGVPVDSAYNIQNGNFRSCGELAATSIVQGGPAPCFLEESAYNMIVRPDIEITDLDLEKHFTANDQQLFKNIKEDVQAHQDVIIENGYTGIINDAHKDDIIGTMMVSIIGRRSLYLKEFVEGLKLCGVLAAVRAHAEIAKPLFVRGEENRKVDANYLFSLMHPHYSSDGTSKRALEECIMDNLQDFLITLEDESICGYSEAIAWAVDDPTEQVAGDAAATEENSQFQMADLTPAGVLGWLTGQQHIPLNGESLEVSVNFDHSCMMRNPNHTICFPIVGACGRVITFPVAHMTKSDQFREVFLLAYCNGGVFANA